MFQQRGDLLMSWGGVHRYVFCSPLSPLIWVLRLPWLSGGPGSVDSYVGVGPFHLPSIPPMLGSAGG